MPGPSELSKFTLSRVPSSAAPESRVGCNLGDEKACQRPASPIPDLPLLQVYRCCWVRCFKTQQQYRTRNDRSSGTLKDETRALYGKVHAPVSTSLHFTSSFTSRGSFCLTWSQARGHGWRALEVEEFERDIVRQLPTCA